MAKFVYFCEPVARFTKTVITAVDNVVTVRRPERQRQEHSKQENKEDEEINDDSTDNGRCVIDREFGFYEFFSFLKFNEFYEF